MDKVEYEKCPDIRLKRLLMKVMMMPATLLVGQGTTTEKPRA